ncbi:hypothetical protein ACFO1B_16390 [Dactylosporangium siamense]|uniref:hypothetical protein n=1 Tax=Dactylosporangium siamense TaxID=685454 RepID=UPI001940AC5A|nr:hypothetical protein [Dactylosporangium siamense]
MDARLTWRLLLVPRLLLAAGVIVWALLNVLTARRPAQPPRRPPTAGDPVGDALAGARPVPRYTDEPLKVTDLRWIVGVENLEVADEDGFNTVVGLDDAVSTYVDVAADGLEDALADQPGIDAVEHTDREVVLVRSTLSLPDVHAAAVRALLAINRDPRPMPRRRPLDPAVVGAVADDVAAVMSGHGFAGRLPGPAFYRLLPDEHLVQIVGLRDGFGHHNDDGTITDARVRLAVDVLELDAADVTAGPRVLSTSCDWAPATVSGIEHVLVTRAVPWCAATASRAAIVDRWVRGLPWHVPDRPRWEAADIAAQWGFRKHARDLLGRSRSPQSAAVAAKHGFSR